MSTQTRYRTDYANRRKTATYTAAYVETYAIND